MPGHRAIYLRPGCWNPPHFFCRFYFQSCLEFVFLAGAKGRWKRKGFEGDFCLLRGEGLLKTYNN